MSIFNLNTSSKKLALIIDIGNDSVGGALAVIVPDQKPHIIFSIREPFSFEEKPTGEKLEKAVFQSLELVISKIMQSGLRDPSLKNSSKKIHQVMCVLSSPWFISRGKTVAISHDQKFVITQRFVDDVLSKELEAFQKNLVEQSPDSPPRHVIEKSLLSIKINGYILKNPIGQKTDQFETSIYMSEADGNFIQSVASIVSKYTQYREDKIVFHTFPSVAFSTISELFVGMQEYLHFDVAGEITDIALVRGGMIQKTVSYPTGTNLLVRQIAKKMSVPTQLARSFFHLYMDNRAEPAAQKEIEQVLLECEGEWSVYLNDALVSLSSADVKQGQTSFGEVAGLPKKIFVTAYPRTFELFNQFLHAEAADETGVWRQSLSVTYLGPELLGNFITSNPVQQFDAFLALETLFASRL